MVPPAPWYPLSAQHSTPASARASMMPWVRAALMSWTAPGSAGEAHSSRPNGIGDDLHVHAVLLVFARSRRAGRRRCGRSAAACRPGSRTPWWRPSASPRRGWVRGRPGARRPRRCTGRRWRSRCRTRRRAGRRCHRTAGGPGPAGPAARRKVAAIACPVPGGARPVDRPGTARRGGQIDRGWVDKHAKLLADRHDLGREPVYQELLCVRTPPTPSTALLNRQVGKG